MSIDAKRRQTVAAFDFDGTISRHDTFLPFLFRVFGYPRVLGTLARLSPLGLSVLLGTGSRDHFKAKLIGLLFPDASVEALDTQGRHYAEAILARLRPGALERITWHRAQGHRLIMVSASLEIYLRPVADRLGFDELLCTRIRSHSGRYEGQIEGGNCRGPEKVRRLQALLGDDNLAQCELHAYGDSDGDREMLAIAEHAYYKPFRKPTSPSFRSF